VYDGVFEVLQWLLFLSAVPPVQLLTGWCVTAKALPDISAISALTAVKHGNCSSLRGPLGKRKLSYYKGFPEQSTPVFNFCLFINERQGIRLRYYKRSC
jgi:hypothetical protein